MAMSSVRILIVVDRAAHPGQRGRASALQSRVAPPARASAAAARPRSPPRSAGWPPGRPDLTRRCKPRLRDGATACSTPGPILESGSARVSAWIGGLTSEELVMTYEERVVQKSDEQVTTPAMTTPPASNVVVERRTSTLSPSGGEVARRVIALIFGLIQAVIVLRIVLLLLDAREGNDLVAFILNTSQLFVAPFEGIFRTNALASGGSILDIAAIAALVGWTILEAIAFWIVNIFRREPA
jgi:hypothetical protein